LVFHPKGGTMPGASASGLGVGCGTFPSPCVSSCSVSSSFSSDIAVVFVVGVHDAP
jgi:hypothetical protein